MIMYALQNFEAAYSVGMHRFTSSVTSILFLCVISIFLCFTAEANTIALSISTYAKGETITIQMPAGKQSKTFTLENPPRLVVDILDYANKPDMRLPKDYGGVWIKDIRSGQFNATTGRVVFELNQNGVIEASQQGSVLTINLAETKGAAKIAEKEKEKPKPVIIIDAGHGGQDPGTIGPKKTQEKTVVLAFAKELEKQLNASGKYKTVLTRKGDYFIPLRERIAHARKSKGNLFISLHADSAPGGSARGLSVYTLSENASDKEAEALAEKENRSDIIAGVDLGGQDKDVTNILISLAQRETNNQSAILADTIAGALRDDGIKLLEPTHRMAGFAVLKAPDIPSVLIETGFLSNQEEESKLNSAAYRAKLVGGIVNGIGRYFQTVAEE